jgi:haloalkane dehalogenase
MKAQPGWINKKMFPFKSKWFTCNGQQMHYIDEGSGDVLLFVHGCPEWSFGYREVIKALCSSYRCVVIDHLGFGLSDKPANGDFSIKAHAMRLTNFIGHLDLKNITLILNDFGGGIGLGYGVTHSHNIKGILLFNTWCWSLKDDPHFSVAGKMMKTGFMKFLYTRFNFPVNIIMPRAFGNKKLLTREVHDHYRKVLPDAKSRVGVYAIAKELMDASDWWQEQWEKMDVLSNKPVSIVWGMKDTFVPASLLNRWTEKFPLAEVIKVEEAGHFVQEECPAQISAGIKALTRSTAVV